MKKILFLILVLSINYSAAAADNQAIERIIGLLETGKPDSAAVLLFDLADIVKEKEEKAEVFYCLGLAMRQLGRRGEGIQYLESAMELSTDPALREKIEYEYAGILMETGDYAGCIKAAQSFRQSFEKSPLMPEILEILGEAYFATKEYLRAFNSFNEITKLYPETDTAFEALKKEGVCLFRMNLISGAAEHLEQYVDTRPPDADAGEAYYYLGLSYEKLGQFESAADAFKKLILDYPSYSGAFESFFRYGEDCYRTGRYAESENAFLNYANNADDKDEKKDEALYYIERIKFKTGEYSSENKIAENFIAKYPGSKRSPRLLFELARYYQLSGDFYGALEKYKILLNNPYYEDYADSAVVSIAELYISENKYAEANIFLRNVIRETTVLSIKQIATLKLGLVSEKKELFDDAIAWYDSTLALNASQDYSFRALFGTGRVYQNMNRWNDAGKIYEKMIKKYPNNPGILDVYLRLSDIYLIQGKLKEAIRNAQESLKIAKGKKKTDILLFIAELYEEIDEDRALQMYSSIFGGSQSTPAQVSKALMCYADLSMSRGENDTALGAYMKVVSADTDSVLVRKAKQKISIIKDEQEK